MKVIAQAEGSRFIVICEQNELANIMGHSWGGVSPCPVIRVGSVIKVTEAYAALHSIRMLKPNLKAIAEAADKIGSVIKLKQGFIDPIVETAGKRET